MANKILFQTLGIILLLSLICGAYDYIRTGPEDASLVSLLDSIGYAAAKSIQQSVTGASVLNAHHDLFILDFQTRLKLAGRVLAAWLILWSMAWVAAVLLSLSAIAKADANPVLRIVSGSVTGIAGMIGGLIGGAVFSGSVSFIGWFTGLAAGTGIGVFLGAHIPGSIAHRTRGFLLISARTGGILAVTAGLVLGVAPHLRPMAGAEADPDTPNVVLFVIDTLRADALGICGGTYASSPEIDRFFQPELQMTGIRADASWTAPSFASLFTGLGPSLHGVVEASNHFSGNAETLAGIFKETGYFTCALMCNPVIPGANGYGNGFDVYINRFQNREADEMLSASLAMIPALKTHRHFFMVVQFMDCHNIYSPSFPYDLRPMNRVSDSVVPYPSIPIEYKDPATRVDLREIDAFRVHYQGALRDADHAFGTILRHLQMHDLLDNTLVVLTSDHGEEFREHGSLDHCVTLYEETVRIPVLFRLPRHASKYRQPPANPSLLLDRTGLISDLGTTILQLSSINRSLGNGMNLLHATARDRPLFLETRRLGFPIKAVVKNEFKYIAPLQPVDAQPKVGLYYPRPWHQPETYNLSTDPDEHEIISPAEPVRQDLQALWSQVFMDIEGSTWDTGTMDADTEAALRELGYIQ